jgi:hypothetical protein
MSNLPDNNLDLELQFLPAWAQQSSTVNPFADFDGETEGAPDRRRFDRDDRRRRPPRRGPGEGPGQRRGPGEGPGQRRGGGEAGGGSRPPYAGRPGGGRPPREFQRHEPQPVLPEVELSLQPEPKGVEALARHIKMTGRAYPLFDIGHFIMKRPDRFHVQYAVIKKADGQVSQPLFLCSLDETLWLSEAEAMDYVLNKHFATFYQAEKIPAEAPKGVFTFVAQCGMSGAILGPPNYHGYQNKLRKIHAERFAHMPFEVYKARVRIVRDEVIVKKWVEDQSYATQYVCLNVPESLKLGSREEVERHFREVHLANVIQPVDSFTMTGQAARNQPCHLVQALYRRHFEEQRRFPIKVVTVLSQMFASHGLQFFKVNKSITHVSVSRPHYLDLSVAPVSEDIKRIIAYINSHPGSNRRQVVEALAPLPAGTVVPEVVAPVTPPAPPPGAPTTEGAAAAAPAAPMAEPQPATPEMAAVISNLHWLIHQGHVIEFASGVLDTAKAPAPRPPRPEKPPKAAAPATTPTAATEASSPAPESAAPTIEGVVTPDETAEQAPEAAIPEAPLLDETPAAAESAAPSTEEQAVPTAPAPPDEPKPDTGTAS